ncbi:glycosyltransferase family 39 protein [Waterburya agarophytonicola K14]|uniref:Glycosyltransferase family 39 protein n=1 Tax=Waterburya agarophytonicola KI4 TaxID=2874699 RepID=A0A964BQF6_9CYAN|nr:glycosyltransferase family 39 protein [Waterburya agarophytonicola]MCC0176015.1 glycosyltransferase family 39 protein [Waterburya agarophytonicola KI4]
MERLGTWKKLFNSDRFCVLSLLVIAIALYTSGLGNLPLRDWDEGIVAGVARNIWRGFPDSNTWLYPTINYDDPYWNKPPLIHWLVAFSYSLFGIGEWSTRLFPALLSACSVPLLYKIGRELFVSRPAAIFSALVYLTFLPIARHGRVAMLDGAINCWFCFAVWCLLRGRKDPRWLLGAGLGLGSICLTKGIMMGILLGGIIIIFLLWDSPKLLLTPHFWVGVILGVIPAIAWYLLQYFHYGSDFLGISLGKQTFNRIWEPVSHVSHPPWYYLSEIAKYSLPWLIFLPYGLRVAGKNYHLSWAKLALIWCGVYLLATSLMVTKLPWYIMPIYPGLSLFIGASLEISWEQNIYFPSWKISMTLLAIVCWVGTIYFGLSGQIEPGLAILTGFIALIFSIASFFLLSSSPYFIPTIIAGFYLALLFLFNSNYWLWELNEAFPVKPLATSIQQHTPPQQNIYTAYPNLRPSLEFYSDRVIIPATDDRLKELWQQTKPVYFLVDRDALNRLEFQEYVKLGKQLDGITWQLISNQ